MSIFLGVAMFLWGCSAPLVQHCDNVEMPTVSEVVPEEQVQLPTKSVLLLDYSGSMHEVYPDLRSHFSPIPPFFYGVSGFHNILASLLDSASPAGIANNFEIILFNAQPYSFDPIQHKVSQFRGLTFPLDLGTADQSTITSWLSAIPENPESSDAGVAQVVYSHPRGAGNGRNENTQIKEVLQKVVDLSTEDTIIWLLTDNLVEKKTHGVSDNEANANKEFYDYLKTESSIKAVLGYPIKDASVFKDRSLMLYGLYHSKGNPTSQQIRHIMGEGASTASMDKGLLWNPKIATLGKKYSCDPTTNQGKPIRLKPIDTEVLTISLNPKALEVSAISCDAHLTMESPKAKCTATVSITNNLNHQTVTKANISLKQQTLHPSVNGEKPSWVGDICANTFALEYWIDANGQKNTSPTIFIKDLKPKESQSIQIRFSMANPPISTSSLSEILTVAQTPKINFDGELFVTVDGIETQLDTGKSDLSCIAKSEDLPELFQKQSQSTPSNVKHDFAFKLTNSGTEQAMLLLFLFGGLGGLGIIGIMRFQGIGLEMLVDGRMHPESPFKLVRISQQKFGKQKGETPFVSISRGWGKNYKVTGVNGYVAEADPQDIGVYRLSRMDDDSDRMKIEVRRAFSGGDSMSSDSSF